MAGYIRRTPPEARNRLRRVTQTLVELRSRQLVAETSGVKWRKEDAEAIDQALAALRSAAGNRVAGRPGSMPH
jgi:hypothetical protein